MHFRVTGDSNEESGVSAVVIEWSGPARLFFLEKNYGVGLEGIVVVLMCRDPRLDFKRRVRLDRKEMKLYVDVMLELGVMTGLDHDERKRLIVARLLAELPPIIGKYQLRDFDCTAFMEDLRTWFAERGATAVSA